MSQRSRRSCEIAAEHGNLDLDAFPTSRNEAENVGRLSMKHLRRTIHSRFGRALERRTQAWLGSRMRRSETPRRLPAHCSAGSGMARQATTSGDQRRHPSRSLGQDYRSTWTWRFPTRNATRSTHSTCCASGERAAAPMVARRRTAVRLRNRRRRARTSTPTRASSSPVDSDARVARRELCGLPPAGCNVPVSLLRRRGRNHRGWNCCKVLPLESFA